MTNSSRRVRCVIGVGSGDGTRVKTGSVDTVDVDQTQQVRVGWVDSELSRV